MTPDNALPTNDDAAIAELLRLAGGWKLVSATQIGVGRGVFSTVWQLELSGADCPPSAVVKLPTSDANGEAARQSGAYDRELLAYRQLWTDLPSSPLVYASSDEGALLIEDLTQHRFVDQLDGLGVSDALAITDALALLHRRFAVPDRLIDLPVRRSAPATFPPEQLRAGLAQLVGRVPESSRRALEALVDRRDELLELFNAQPQTLCHGDPRADNVAFDADGSAILFDWQQLAIQHGEADLAWLAATSIDADHRNEMEDQLVARYADLTSADATGTRLRYRVGFLLPGFAVLLLAQRAPSDERMARLVTTSVERISRAVTDLDVVGTLDGA